MKKSYKVALIGAGTLAALAVVGVGVASASEGDGYGGGGSPPNPNGTGTWYPPQDGYAGGGAGGRIGGAVVDDAVMNAGKLPAGSIILSGPNTACRVFAIGFFWSNNVDYGIMANPADLADVIPDIPDTNVETAECTIVAVSPNGEQVRVYASPPRTPEELGSALRDIAEFSGQM